MGGFLKKIDEQTTNLKRFFAIMFLAAKGELIFNIALSILCGIIDPVSLLISKNFLNELVIVIANKDITGYFILLLGILFSLAVVQSILNNCIDIVKTKLSDKLSIYITEHVLSIAIELPMDDFDDSSTYNKIQLTVQETPDRCLILVNCLGAIVKNLIQLVGVVGILISLHWMIGIVPIVFLTPLFTFRYKISKKWFKIQEERTEKLRFIFEIKNILLKNEYINELKLFNASNKLKDKAVKLQKEFNEENILNSKRYALINILTTIVDGIYSFIVKLWVVMESIQMKYTLGSISMYINAIDIYETEIENVLQTLTLTFEQILYIGYICEIDKMQKTNLKLIDLNEDIQKIEFKNVSFKYRNCNQYILKNISLILEKDHLYAFVGINGSGKTTLLKLLMKFYLPLEGEIYVNDINIKKINEKSLRVQISAMFQNFIKYPFSVKENISFDNKENVLKHITELCKTIEFDKDINKLPDLFDTQLCCEWKEGVNLSGGQWQKLAYIRCLYKKANIYIFDEPFSNIDSLVESKITKNIRKLRKGKIGIIISHQFSIMPYVDKIFVLENGEIVEMGTHNKLMRIEKKYYCLLKAEEKKCDKKSSCKECI